MFRRLYSVVNEKRKHDYIAKMVNNGLKLGKDVEIIADFFFDPSHCYLITIGDNCTICPNVRLIAHDASTFKFLGYTKLGRITIGENSFVGDSTVVLPNVTIGKNCIIGAASVVTKDIPDGSIAFGNPARVRGSLIDYLGRVEAERNGKKIFSEAYLINNLDRTKIKELLASVNDAFGYII
jgi:maltose O-acetyltransferase